MNIIEEFSAETRTHWPLWSERATERIVRAFGVERDGESIVAPFVEREWLEYALDEFLRGGGLPETMEIFVVKCGGGRWKIRVGEWKK